VRTSKGASNEPDVDYPEPVKNLQGCSFQNAQAIVSAEVGCAILGETIRGLSVHARVQMRQA